MARELYEKVHDEWKDRPDKSTPVFAKDLMHFEDGIYKNSENKALKEIYGDDNISLGRKEGSTVGKFSAVIGADGEATAPEAFSEGFKTKSHGTYAHSEGGETEADGDGSHTEGYKTIAKGTHQHVQGRFNKEDSWLAHILGNGYDDEHRSNAHTIDWNGNAWFAGNVTTASGSNLNAIGSPETTDIDFSTYFT